MYCDAALPAEAVAAAMEPVTANGLATAASDAPRVLLLLDIAGMAEATLARALQLSAYEAGQRLRRGGPLLHRVAMADAAAAEAARLQAEGIRSLLVPESEVRSAGIPLVATGGRQEPGGLRLEHEEGELRLASEDVLLVVRGPIAREYQTPELKRKHLHIATLEPGYRIHVHRRSALRPVELDAGSFALGLGAGPLSSLLELTAWVEALRGAAPLDDAFRLVPPALAPAEPERSGLGRSLGALAQARNKGRQQVLDNLAQFRFYSGWRGAFERRRPR
jgi:hypothetical protein